MGLDKILVVDDERVIRQAMELWLRDKRYGVSSADSMAGGDRMLRNDTFDLVFLDLNLPDGTGMELLERIQRMPERPHVVLMTGDATLASAISAIRLGAFDYLVKPFGKDNIELVLRRAEAFNHVVRVNQILSADLSDTRDLMGSSPAFETLREMIRKVAPTEATVLIEGENGTGKELVARAIYRASGRAQSPYIKVNCAAVPENLIESEFFGHEKDPSPVPRIAAKAASNWPMAAHCSSTKSARFRRTFRPSCCASCRSANLNASAAPRRSRWMSAC